MHPSSEQQPAVVRRGCDVAVTAGAGTGKTSTLVARYLSLLADGLDLRSVVAVTFTRKAAREMRNRVRAEVRTYLERSGLEAAEREEWQKRYTELDAARIGTIHSLCTEILRAHPAEAGIDPRFEVIEEGQVNILRGRAVDEALAWAADDEEAVTLFELLGERTLRRTLEVLVASHRETQQAIEDLPDDLLHHWGQVLASRQESVLAGLLARQDWQCAVETLTISEALDSGDLAELQRRAALGAINSATGPLASRLASFARLDGIGLGGGRRASWPGGADQLAEMKGALRMLRDLWRANAPLLGLALTPHDDKLATAVSKLRAVLDYAGRRYSSLKDERDGLDFDDLEHDALALLREHSDVRERWQREVRAILVDEFQDTNGRQRDLVALLNGAEGKLFIVGDAKQSIYRFRGADVTVFRDERESIEERGAAYQLRTSYRAHQELVQGLNDLMLPVLGEEVDPERPWAEPFAPLLHHREESSRGFVAPHIELHLTVGSKGGGALDRAADAVVARIIELRSDGLDFGDVAILCRASTSFSSYEDALERATVPFLTVAGRGFYGRPEIRDLLNALQALSDPADELALSGLLRSPAFALSDVALYRLCQARGNRGESLSLWHVLERGGGDLSGLDGPRADRAVRLISELRSQIGRAPVADVLKALLDSTDYRAALLRAGQTRGARNVSKLLADAHGSGIVGVGEFLEYVGRLRDSGTREGEARATAEGAVQIMTVHAAKGLEFPLVVLGDATYGGGGASGVLVDPDLGLLLPMKDEEGDLAAVYSLGKARAADQEDAESDRLFYVAATRACEKLIISGYVGLKKDHTLGKVGGWLGKIARPLGLTNVPIDHDAEGSRTIQVDLQIGDTPVSCRVHEPEVTWEYRLDTADATEEPQPILPPPLLGAVAWGVEQEDQRTSRQDRIPPQRVWRVVPPARRPRAPAWVIGSLVHEALAAWRFPDDTFDRWAEARARGYGIADSRQLTNAVGVSRRLLRRFRDHHLFETMNGAARRLHEVPYSLISGGRVERGIIDAMYLHDGVWTIVEFKTDDVRSQVQLQQLLDVESYIAQAQRYVAAVELLVGQRPQVVICLLNYAGAVRLHPIE